MGTIRQLQMSTRILHSPRPGPDVCVNCFNLTRGFSKCFACAHLERHLAAMVPISYSVGHEYLHHVLADYKRIRGPRAEAAAQEVGSLLSTFLGRHEGCVAQAAGVRGFEIVTTVPSSDPRRDESHPLRRIVSAIEETEDRHERLLRRTSEPMAPRTFDPRGFRAIRRLDGQSVLLIDDTWTTGASVESAAAALRAAGAGTVAAVVVGRHLNREWHDNDEHLDALPFDWNECAVCACSAGRSTYPARLALSRRSEPPCSRSEASSSRSDRLSRRSEPLDRAA